MKKGQLVFTIGILFATLLIIVCFGEYTYPFERTIEPTLIAQYDFPSEHAMEHPGELPWHGAYEKYGLYPASLHFDVRDSDAVYGIGWPPLALKSYCYIVTYGQKIDKLSYNVWDTVDEPIRTGAKSGHIEFADEFSPTTVYIYRIPKIRIENGDFHSVEVSNALGQGTELCVSGQHVSALPYKQQLLRKSHLS